jgi:hypothetical protein
VTALPGFARYLSVPEACHRHLLRKIVQAAGPAR